MSRRIAPAAKPWLCRNLVAIRRSPSLHRSRGRHRVTLFGCGVICRSIHHPRHNFARMEMKHSKQDMKKSPSRPACKPTRIPRDLQTVFLASNRGEDVHKPPASNVASKVFGKWDCMKEAIKRSYPARFHLLYSPNEGKGIDRNPRSMIAKRGAKEDVFSLGCRWRSTEPEISRLMPSQPRRHRLTSV